MGIDHLKSASAVRFSGLVDEVLKTKQKSYEAREIRAIVTYGDDGQKKVTVFKANLFRDRGAVYEQSDKPW